MRAIFFLFLLVWAGFLAVRTARYSARSRALQADAETFRREYPLGGANGRLVVLGDSTAIGVGADRLEDTLAFGVARALGASSVENRGVTGARVSDVVAGQLADVPESALVFVSVSANDATHGTSPEAFAADVRRLLGALAGHTTYLTDTPDFAMPPALPSIARRIVSRRSARLAAIIREEASRYPNVTVVPLHGRGTLGREEYSGDGFHPNGTGYRAWASLIPPGMTR